mgnify:CR=1 FL=1
MGMGMGMGMGRGMVWVVGRVLGMVAVIGCVWCIDVLAV